MVIRRRNGVMAWSLALTLLRMKRPRKQAHTPFTFASKQAHKATAEVMAFVLMISRSFILIFVRYVFWLKGWTSAIPPAAAECCK